jgi:hypothetical protein
MDPKVMRRAVGASAARDRAAGGMRRRKPRAFEEWKALASWGKLPAWELRSPGFQLRRAREAAGLTQVERASE